MFKFLVFYLLFLILAFANCRIAKKIPVFANQYTAHGEIYLPYAELKEPFSAYFDGEKNRSRIDYYGDLMITLQKSPNQNEEYGAEYKIAYDVDILGNPRRVCFKVEGSSDNLVSEQSILPDLTNFNYIKTEKCPLSKALFSDIKNKNVYEKMLKLSNSNLLKRKTCELWQFVEKENEKISTYSFWLTKEKHSNEAIPVYYQMIGYNSLLGSHYDHYLVSYELYREGKFNNDIYNINEKYKCGGFPGPGKKNLLSFNPMKAYFKNSHNHIDDIFEDFKEKHKINYEDKLTHLKRRHIFLNNLRFIEAHNRKQKKFKLSVNHLSDKSQNELAILRGRYTSKGYNGGKSFETKKLVQDIPENWDWRLAGAVNPVKDQAVCGSCWAFGTTGTIEGVYFVKTGHLINLSEQQLIDCSWQQGDNGCDGGEDFRAYEYIQKFGGIATEDDYGHYLGVDGKCHANNSKKSVQLSGFVNVTRNDADALKVALFENGPVTIAINAAVKTFSFYSHGVYDDKECLGDEDHLDHQVLLVGYGKLFNQSYWLVKNSWSTYWGNDGYILISQENNICGVTTQPTYPILKLEA